MNREYKNVLFTNHALERLELRRITQDMIVKTIEKPDDKVLEDDGDTKFIKTINSRNVQVVSKYLPDEKKWLVKSAWVRGEDDPKPFWQQIFSFVLQLVKSFLDNRNKNGNKNGNRR